MQKPKVNGNKKLKKKEIQMIENQTLNWQPYKQQFLQHDVVTIANRAAELMAALLAIPEYTRKDLRGGILVLVPDETCTTHTTLCIGNVQNMLPEELAHFAIRKCEHLRNDPKAKSSFAVQEMSGVHGGGIPIRSLWDENLQFRPFWTKAEAKYAGRAFVAFSGLHARAEEALVLVLAKDMDWISIQDAENVASLSSNHYFQALYQATRKPEAAKTE